MSFGMRDRWSCSLSTRAEANLGFCFEEQYRYAARDYLWELPAGRIDPGETALAAGKRELLEETGTIARDNGSAPCISTPAPAFSTRR